MGYKINQQLGDKIARERKKRQMTQEELADKIGVQTATISNIEREKQTPPSIRFIKLPKYLDCTLRNCSFLDKQLLSNVLRKFESFLYFTNLCSSHVPIKSNYYKKCYDTYIHIFRI